MPSIGLALNVYSEINALPGALETAAGFFDEIKVIHAGPGGKLSTDGTMELLERWGIDPLISRIDDGFGVVRTQCIRACRTDWVMIMDADERFHPLIPIMTCDGIEQYPHVPNPALTVTAHQPEMFNQGSLLRTLIGHNCMSVRATRRHWFDYTWKRPCQNWQVIPDWQLRIVKNDERIYYTPDVKMHERLLDRETNDTPKYATEREGDPRGVFIDHYHCFWKAQEPEQRKQDIAIYDALDQGRPVADLP